MVIFIVQIKNLVFILIVTKCHSPVAGHRYAVYALTVPFQDMRLKHFGGSKSSSTSCISTIKSRICPMRFNRSAGRPLASFFSIKLRRPLCLTFRISMRETLAHTDNLSHCFLLRNNQYRSYACEKIHNGLKGISLGTPQATCYCARLMLRQASPNPLGGFSQFW